MFFEFDQNNSGGVFDIDDKKGIGPRVWIEADSLDDALNRIDDLGIYFNGVDDGHDCPCCGDRWYPPWGRGKKTVEINAEYDFNWHDKVYVHLKTGEIVYATKNGPPLELNGPVV
jgi:hypothetical protein